MPDEHGDPAAFSVSVVIPLHNKGRFIARTLASALAQRVTPLEIIIVDDGSTDDGPAAVAPFLNETVRLIRQPNAGPGAARNRGVGDAHGEWVAFLDGDDLWSHDHLAELAAIANRFPEATVIATDFVEASPKTVFAAPIEPARGPRRLDYFAESHVRSRLCSSTTAVRRHVLLDAGGFPSFFPGEDVDLWVRLALDQPIAVSDRVTALYVRDTGGLMEQAQSQRVRPAEMPPPLSTLDQAFDPARHGAKAASIGAFRIAQLRLAARQALYRGDARAARHLLAACRKAGGHVPVWMRVAAMLPAAALNGLRAARSVLLGRGRSR